MTVTKETNRSEYLRWSSRLNAFGTRDERRETRPRRRCGADLRRLFTSLFLTTVYLTAAPSVHAQTGAETNVQDARTGPLTLAVYAPSLALADAAARLALAQRLAKHLTRGLRRRVVPQVFARARELNRRVGLHEIDLVMADPLYLAEHVNGFEIAAGATSSGKHSTPWAFVVASQGTTLKDLKGKRVALPNIGRRDRWVAEQVLLANELPARYFNWLRVPNAASALSAIEVGTAAAALVPRSAAATRHVVALTLDAPLPLLALPRAARSRLTHDQVLAAVQGFQARDLALDGWAPASQKTVVVLLRPVKRQPLLSQKRPSYPEPRDLVSHEPPPWKLAGLDLLLPDPAPVP